MIDQDLPISMKFPLDLQIVVGFEGKYVGLNHGLTFSNIHPG